MMTVLLLCSSSLLVAALSNSYTYTEPGVSQQTPAPYVLVSIEEYEEYGGLDNASDLFVDTQGWLYIADTGNNRVLILNEKSELVRELKEYSYKGEPCSFRSPSGVYVSDAGELYVADTKNGRIALFTRQGEFLRVIEEPKADTLRKDFIYQPQKIAVNSAGFLYVVGAGMVEGIAEFNTQGEFVRFAASNEAKPDLLEYFWTRTFASKEQKENSALIYSEEFNSVAIDTEGFFLTVSTTAGIQRFNTKGDNITRYSGSTLLIGDYRTTETAQAQEMQEKEGDGISKLVDVAIGPDGLYSTADAIYQRIFTYDYEGNLLWAFGADGALNGTFKKITALSYLSADELLVLDGELGRVNRFTLTDFGRQAQSGARLRYNGKNREAAEQWAAILDYDANYPLAYLGKGILAYENNEFAEAMTYFRLANHAEQYSKAFVRYRRQLVNQWFPVVMTGFLIVLVLGMVCRKLWRRHHPVSPKRVWLTDSSALTLGQQLQYSRYAILHPFKAFWDMKVYKKASVGSATILFGLLALINTLKTQSTGFLFDTDGADRVNLLQEVFTVFMVVLLFCAANWALTTLMDGEGTFRQLYIMTAYAVVPLMASQLLAWGMSHVLALPEGAVITVIGMLGIVLTLLLIFVGTTVTHQYSAGKNLISLLLTLVAIAAILFLLMIGIEMTDWVITFVKTLGKEVILRL